MTKMKVKKVNMTQVFLETGEVVPVTLVVPEDSKGQTLDTDFQGLTLKEGDMVTVSGISKGKGFQGVVKRHGFKGGRRSHGQKHSEREAGSIGGGGRAGGRVAKGMRMAGRMGGEKITVKNLKVVRVDSEGKEIYISGAVPGRRGSKLEIKLT
ncbi:MAG: 50S ribosomal protein L3 [Candidatus Zambryskibacteria bacterium RIFCSPHIGHO2_01_FULL_49_18]|uniref:Large ribosomal subunit protein uL3 n=2 Tax=Candidatus Zambryskiibacteriota TaxID=1817925 RepID=A0A1G2T4Y0_9BACT|nr:MAG: 50S ribosomal protein L3 [Candidatus Zambryskibacteria bacterium RIFCSPHIGHO2_01_FULL_49_18]OHB05624.1 MAG: 50S ribosomal protein L3 [Candidatus Zambryskibacteria bacterium RIFCSPLOWO2_01_FULL_47_14]